MGREHAQHVTDAIAEPGGTASIAPGWTGRSVACFDPHGASIIQLMTRLAVLLLGVSAIAEAGSIKGTVLFEGEAPTQAKLQRDVDPKCSKDRSDEAIVVTKGKLRDVLVRIKNGTTGAHAAPATPAVIDQRDCMYAPRVVGLVAGQKLAVRNSDGTFHNVHGTLVGKDLFNKPQAPKSAERHARPFGRQAGRRRRPAMRCPRRG